MAEVAALTIRIEAGQSLRTLSQVERGLKQTGQAAEAAQLPLRRLSQTIRTVERDARGHIVAVRTLSAGWQRAAVGARGLQGAFLQVRTSVLASVAGFYAMVRAVGTFTREMDRVINLEQRLRLVTRSTDELNRVWDQLVQTSLRSHTALESSIDLFFRLKTAQSQLGLSTSGLVTLTETITRSIAAVGLSSDRASALVLQLGQAFSQGRLNSDEFRSVTEQLPPLLNSIAKVMGVNVGQLKALSSQGKITSDVMVRAFEDMRLSGIAAAEPPRTVAGAFQDMSTTITDVLSKSGPLRDLYDAIVDALFKMTQAIRDAATALDDWARSPTLSPTGDTVRTLDLWIAKFHEAQRVWGEGWSDFDQNTTDMVSGIDSVVGAVGRLVDWLGRAWTAFDQLWEEAKRGVDDTITSIDRSIGNVFLGGGGGPIREGDLPIGGSILNRGRRSPGGRPFIGSTADERVGREAFARSHAAAAAGLHSRFPALEPLATGGPAATATDQEAKAHERAVEAIEKHIDANDLLLDQSARLIAAHMQGTAAVEAATKAAFIENAVERANIDTKHLTAQEAAIATATIKEQAAALFESNKALERTIELEQEGKSVTEQYLTPLEEFAATQKQLNELLNAGTISAATYGAALLDANEQVADAEREALLRRRDLAAGAQVALQDYVDSATNAAAGIHEALTNAFTGVEDVLTQFFTTGKMRIRDFLTSVARDLMRFAIRTLVIGNLLRWMGGLFNLGNTSPLSQALGGGAGSVVFQHGGILAAGHVGLVGERGPELIQPTSTSRILDNTATRHALGAGGGGITFGDINVSVPAGMQQTPQEAARFGAEVARQIKAQVVDTMRETTRPGGLFYAGPVVLSR